MNSASNSATARVLSCMLLAACVFPVAKAQSPGTTSSPAPHEFAAATIKENRKHDGRWRAMFIPTGYTATGVPLKTLVQDAWNTYDEAKIAGLSGWMTAELFDVEARVEADQLPAFGTMSPEAKQELLRDLLRRRFGLQAVYEKRTGLLYVLSVAPHGPKLTPAKAPTPDGKGLWFGNVRGKMGAEHAPISELAHVLGLTLGHPAKDATGITGQYDISLNWQPDLEPGSTAPPQTTDTPNISIFTALREELGLELKPAKEPIDVLVVKSAHPPTEN